MSTANLRSGASPEQPPKTLYEGESLFLLSIILIVGIFASTMPQPAVLGNLPLFKILHGELHKTKTEVAAFGFIGTLFWYFKPLAGILTDAFPLFKTRRRYYLLISSAMACAAWIAMGFLPKTYDSLLWGTIIVNLFMVMMSTVAGAFLVEVGQAQGATGRLTGIRQTTSNVCTLIQGPLGGFLASGSFMIAAGANALMVISIFPVAYFLLREKPTAMRNSEAFHTAGIQLKMIGRSGTFWMAIVFILLYYFAPGVGTLQQFRQSDVMHLSSQQMGYLGSISGLGGILASLLYVSLARKLSLRLQLAFGIVTAGVGTFLYLFYSSYGIAFAIDFQNGFFGAFAECALIDLAARATPAGCEGLGYSLILSGRNFALKGSDFLGSFISDKYHVTWNTMVSVNATCTLLVLVMLPFMPKLIMSSRDGNKPNTENTGEPEMGAA